MQREISTREESHGEINHWRGKLEVALGEFGSGRLQVTRRSIKRLDWLSGMVFTMICINNYSFPDIKVDYLSIIIGDFGEALKYALSGGEDCEFYVDRMRHRISLFDL